MSRELQTLNGQNKLALWAGRISECRSSGQKVKVWCKENGVCEQTCYKWILRATEDYLTPIYDRLHMELLCRAVLHTDETTLQVLRKALACNASCVVQYALYLIFPNRLGIAPWKEWIPCPMALYRMTPPA